MFLKIAYRYIGFDYLVADEAGNLYLLPHFRYKRTVYYKPIKPFRNGTKKAIKYHGSNISFKQLREKAYPSTEIIEVY
jgi:hypothetical protein